MNKKVLVIIQGPYVPEAIKMIEDGGLEAKVVPQSAVNTPEGLTKAAADCGAVMCSAHRWTAEMFDNLPNVRCIVKSGVGLDAIDLKAATEHGVPVANTPGKNAGAVAEFAVTAMLSLLRGVVTLDKNIHDRSRNVPVVMRHEMNELTVGLMGFGNIARCVAKLLSGFGCRIIAYDLYPNMKAAEELNVEIVSAEQVIRESDIISIHTPLTPETKYMINRDTMAQMKEGVLLVNTARGGIIQEDDLYDALKSGHIAAAALDVTEVEPIPADHPLLKLDNIQFSNHKATATLDAMKNQYYCCAEQMLQFYRGETPQFVVNPDYANYLNK